MPLTKPLGKNPKMMGSARANQRHPDLTQQPSGSVQRGQARIQFYDSAFDMQLLFQERQEFRGRKSSHFSFGDSLSLAYGAYYIQKFKNAFKFLDKPFDRE